MPLQQRGPPICLGADTARGVAQAAAVGDAWLASGRQSTRLLRTLSEQYLRKLEDLARPFTGIPMFRELHVAQDAQRAELEMKAAFEQMYASYARWGHPGERYDQDFEVLKHERIIVGDPEQCAEQVRHYHEDWRGSVHVFRAYWPGMESEQALDAIGLVGQEVIGRIKR